MVNINNEKKIRQIYCKKYYYVPNHKSNAFLVTTT